MTRAIVPLFLLLAAVPATAAVPPVLVPSRADSVTVSAPEAPFLTPGRGNPGDSLRKSPARLAREQYALGRELERAGHAPGAIAAYRNALRLDPTLPEAHYRMGRLYSNVHQHQAAAREYAAELEKHSGHPEAGRWLGLEMAQLGDSTGAIARLERITSRDPNDEASWQALGFAYSSAGRAADGERALRRALALDPNDADAWRDLGAVLAARKRIPEARDAYRRAAKLAPRDALVWVNLGNLERREGRFDAALDAYARALERDSTQVLAWRGRVNTFEAQGRADSAAAALRAWVARSPDNHDVRMEAMERFDALGRKDIALELARDGVRVTPRSGESHLALAMALHEAGNERASLMEMRRAQSMLQQPAQRARISGLIGALRARAPDSLRAMYAADSVANAAGAPPDTATRGR